MPPENREVWRSSDEVEQKIKDAIAEAKENIENGKATIDASIKETENKYLKTRIDLNIKLAEVDKESKKLSNDPILRDLFINNKISAVSITGQINKENIDDFIKAYKNKIDEIVNSLVPKSVSVVLYKIRSDKYIDRYMDVIQDYKRITKYIENEIQAAKNERDGKIAQDIVLNKQYIQAIYTNLNDTIKDIIKNAQFYSPMLRENNTIRCV